MDVRFLGTGGRDGWPEPGCPCASCRRAAAAGPGRRGVSLLVDGRLRLDPGQPPRGAAPGYQISELPGGWDITGPDGARAAGRPRAGCGARTRTNNKAVRPGRPRPAGLPRPARLLAVPRPGPGRRHRGVPQRRSPRRLRAGAEPPGRAVAGHRPRRRRRAEHGARARGPRAGSREPAAPEAGQGGEPAWRPQRTLVLGGARSGKSREAELELAGEPDVTYLAAGPVAGRTPGPGPTGSATPSGPSGSPPTRPGGRPGGRPWRAPTWPGRCAAWTGRC